MRSVLLVGLTAVLAGSSAAAQAPAEWVTVSGRVVLPSPVPVPGPRAIAGAPAGVSDESVVVNPGNRENLLRQTDEICGRTPRTRGPGSRPTSSTRPTRGGSRRTS